MTDLDRMIEEALDAEDRVIMEKYGEQGLFGQFKSVFHGKTAWVSIVSVIAGTLINIIFFYAAWKFFTTTGLDARVTWGAIAWFAAIMVAFMKVWFWMRMESNRILRELKRIELQIVRKNGV